MKPKHTLLPVLLACAWCMAPAAHATTTTVQGHDGGHADSASNASSNNGHLFGDSGDAGPASSSLPASVHRAAGSSNDCDPAGATAGLGPHMPTCSSSNNGSGSNSSGSNDGSSDSSRANLSWQSLLPGSIQ